MKLYEVFFSPTGGTRRAADAVLSGMGPDRDMVDLSRPHTDLAGRNFASDGLAVIAVPSFGGRVPPPAAERIRQLHGNGCGAVLLGVYGNRAYEGTLRELAQAAGQAGFRPIAAVAAVAEHSIVRACERPAGQHGREGTCAVR